MRQDDWMSQSISFLYFVANKLITKLSKQSDIEITREEAELFLDYEEVEEIKNRVPFAIGMEFINDKWISSIWEKITDIYRREISSYKGTVKDFLMERNTNIYFRH
jgi:non-specific serine/threonine protein kinase